MPTTLFTLPQSNLAANATFNSVPNPGPVALPSDCADVVCSLSMSSTDQQNSAKAITWTVYVALPGAAPANPPPAAGWTPLAQESFQGGTFVGKDGQTHGANLSFTESLPPQFRGGWLAAAGQNAGAAFNGQSKVGCSVVSEP